MGIWDIRFIHPTENLILPFAIQCKLESTIDRPKRRWYSVSRPWERRKYETGKNNMAQVYPADGNRSIALHLVIFGAGGGQNTGQRIGHRVPQRH